MKRREKKLLIVAAIGVGLAVWLFQATVGRIGSAMQ